MGIYKELANLSIEELIDFFRKSPPDGEEYAFSFYSEVAYWLGRHEAGEKFLREQLHTVAGARLRATLFGLVSSSTDSTFVLNQLTLHLGNEDPLIITEAIDSLTRLNGKTDLVRIISLGQHPSEYVRAAVLRFMVKLHPNEAIDYLLEGLKDFHYLVREQSVDGLGDLAIIEAIPKLKPLTQDPHPHVQQAAITAIRMLEDL